MFRSRSWFAGGWGRPKNPHSLEHLKYLYNVLARNQTVSEHNRGLLVESLRSIAEILIWGDQNDSSVFDFFLEKNMLSFFLRIMRQRSGGSSFVCVQLLQTLNILFENIRNETSLYYLLSNNHVNSIIVHKFDFSDEEVMAYYISFLKTLSFKLNGHTIHFFYNEHTNDFPLYTEAIKFFNHKESMVRIAVRTLTLNVYKVQDTNMLKFIRDKTAAPYFSNLVWFIGKHILELDTCVRNDADHQSQQKLDDLVAEHLDHLHYLNDILCLNIPDLNEVLTEHLLHKLFIPLYIYSLTSNNANRIKLLKDKPFVSITESEQIQRIETITKNLAAILYHKGIDLGNQDSPKRGFGEDEQKPRVSCVVSLFLLSQVFLIITHVPLVSALAWIILQADHSIFEEGATKILEHFLKNKQTSVKLGFSKPQESLEKALATSTSPYRFSEPGTSGNMLPSGSFSESFDLDPDLIMNSEPSTSKNSEASTSRRNSAEDLLNSEDILNRLAQKYLNENDTSAQSEHSNITDEEKEKLAQLSLTTPTVETQGFSAFQEKRPVVVETKPFLETILKSLDCSENDYIALFALCLLYALVNNTGLNKDLLDVILTPCVKPDSVQITESQTTKRSLSAVPMYSETLVDKLISIVQLSCQPSSRVRLVSLELSLQLLSQTAGGLDNSPPLSTESSSSGLTAAERRAKAIDIARQQAATLVINFYKSEELFLDMFEDEYYEMSKRPLNVEWLCMDAAILLPPTGTPMTGIAFTKRLPCGEVERARRAIRGYFLIRTLSLKLNKETDVNMPLTNPSSYYQIGNVLDLNNSDLISCMVVLKDGSKSRRFMVIDPIQIILVEPEPKRLGWGISKLVGNLQDLEVTGDKDDSRCLHLTIHKPPSSTSGSGGRIPLLQAKFVFDDHIRCMAAKQRLTKGKQKARQKKMQQIARLLEISTGSVVAVKESIINNAGKTVREHRPLFTAGTRVPGFAAAIRKDTMPGVTPRSRHIEGDRSTSASGEQSPMGSTPPVLNYERESIGSYFSNSVNREGARQSTSRSQEHRRSSGFRRQSPAAGVLREQCQSQKYREGSQSRDGSRSSREGSPRMPRPRSEEIPLEPLSTTPDKTLQTVHNQMIQSRPHAPPLLTNEPDLLKSCTLAETPAVKEPTTSTLASEETSFISREESKERKPAKKGSIETI